jgi:hypothetical protein
MQYLVSIVAVCPIRKEPSHRSEMVSQLLFGETVLLLETKKDFVHIRCLYDDYEGWIQSSQLMFIDESSISQTPLGYSYKRNAPALFNNTQMFLSVGTPVLNPELFGAHKVEYMEEYILEYGEFSFDPYIVKTVTLLYENVPYLWGGKSSFGIDCSGFTQQVFKVFNLKLMRDAYQQATQGEVIENLQEVACGDLAFFDNEEGKITHVGILLNSTEIIHASGRVRRDKMDVKGIINIETGEITHKLKVIRRITESDLM